MMAENLFDKIPEKSGSEIITELLATQTVRIERIVSFGQAAPEGYWYDQRENEWVLLLEGEAQLQIDNQLIDLLPGYHLIIPSGMKHRVEKTSEKGRTVWLAVFYTGRAC